MRKVGYEEIKEMHASAVELSERGNNTAYSDYIASYCEDAFEYIDLMAENGYEADLSLESLQGMFMSMLLFQRKYTDLGMEFEECLDLVKEKQAGYLMLSVYCHYESIGVSAEIKLNDSESGLVLVIHKDKNEPMVFNPSNTLEKAFAILDGGVNKDGIMMLSRQDDFIYAIYEDVGCEPDDF